MLLLIAFFALGGDFGEKDIERRVVFPHTGKLRPGIGSILPEIERDVLALRELLCYVFARGLELLLSLCLPPKMAQPSTAAT